MNYIGLSEPLVSILENLTGRIRITSAWCSFQQYFSYFWEVLVLSLSLIFYYSDSVIFFIILTVWYFLLFWQCDIFYCSDSVIFFCFSFNNLISFIGVWSEVFITGFASGLTRQMPLVEQEVLTIPEHLISPPVFQWGLCYLC